MTVANRTATGRPSLVDGAEHAVRDWLAPGRFREGDRLPTELELAAMLGVSRGTLRAALVRLEDSGEIVRRQGSGTYVGRMSSLGRGERLRRVETYSVRVPSGSSTLAGCRIERIAAGERVGTALELDAATEITFVRRVIATADGAAAVCHDYYSPRIRLPSDASLRAAFAEMATSFDLLVASQASVSTSRSTVSGRLVAPDSEDGTLLELSAAAACMILEELVLDTAGRPLMFSSDVIRPERLQLEILQSVEAAAPLPIEH